MGIALFVSLVIYSSDELGSAHPKSSPTEHSESIRPLEWLKGPWHFSEAKGLERYGSGFSGYAFLGVKIEMIEDGSAVRLSYAFRSFRSPAFGSEWNVVETIRPSRPGQQRGSFAVNSRFSQRNPNSGSQLRESSVDTEASLGGKTLLIPRRGMLPTITLTRVGDQLKLQFLNSGYKFSGRPAELLFIQGKE